jgi:Fe-S-cluster-containing hydrogenase component 2
LDKFSSCEACYQICPVDAIKPGKPPEFSEESCQTCLACLPVCPIGAFSAEDAVPALLTFVVRGEVKNIELVCEAHPAAEDGLADTDVAIRVGGCLAGLGTGAYLALVALGLEKVSLRIDACSQCPWGTVKPQIQEQISSAQKHLQPWGLVDRINEHLETPGVQLIERLIYDADNPPLSRRDFFRLASQKSQLTAARMLASEADQGDEKTPSKDRMRLINAIRHLRGDLAESDLNPSLTGLGYATLEISEDCTACAACTRGCPTGSLMFYQESQTDFSITFSPSSCIGCDLCTHVCAPGAISIHYEPSFQAVYSGDDPMTLIQGDLTRCGRCNVLFAAQPGALLCPLCEFRRQNPFSSTMPPGISLRNRPAKSSGEDS